MTEGGTLSRGRFDASTRWIAFVGFLGLLVAALLTVCDVLTRWLFNSPIEGWDDLSQLVYAVVIVACFPAGLLQGHNITIRFLGRAVGDRFTYWLEAFGAFLTFIFFVLVAWQFVVLTDDNRVSGDTTMTAEITTWPWWAVATLLAIFCVPVQAKVLIGHWQRAVTGSGPGGTIEPDHADPLADNENEGA